MEIKMGIRKIVGSVTATLLIFYPLFLASIQQPRSSCKCASKVAGADPNRPTGAVESFPKAMFPYFEEASRTQNSSAG